MQRGSPDDPHGPVVPYGDYERQAGRTGVAPKSRPLTTERDFPERGKVNGKGEKGEGKTTEILIDFDETFPDGSRRNIRRTYMTQGDGRIAVVI